MQAPAPSTRTKASLPASALHKALILGLALAAAPAFSAVSSAQVVAPSAFVRVADEKKAEKPKTTAAKAKAGAKKTKKASRADTQAAAARKAQDNKPGPLADFGKEAAPGEVVHVANWVSYTRNAKKKSFVLIDKKSARLYVFDPQGKLKSSTPVLLGKAQGDDSAPGVGSKPISKLAESEKTTPAGRFLALPGRNTRGEDIIWIDYNAAVSMHRLRQVSAKERRSERMSTADIGDNRISNGCVNVPPSFYNSVLKPTVARHGAFVYVLPETRTPQQQFGSFDVAAAREKSAQAPQATPPAPARRG
ncbi:MAG TPA: L,D-transpeptidase [Ramlibacter sp.]|nr:L,D-transpeptidase [Ramlibacter sp.]